MGKVVEQFWDPEWFQTQCMERAEGEDTFCLKGGTIDIKHEDPTKTIISRMNQPAQKEVQEIRMQGLKKIKNKAALNAPENMHTECTEVGRKYMSDRSKEQEIQAEVNRARRAQRGEEDMFSEKRLKDKFARALQNEGMMFRRRVRKVIEGRQNVNEMEWDVEISQAAADGSAGI